MVVLISAILSHPDRLRAADDEYFRGVNLFGGWQSLFGGSDAFATPEMLTYFQSKGLNTFRVGIAWERLQPTLNGPFDTTYLSKMDKLVADAKARGQKLTFVPLPGKYKGNIPGSSAVPQSAFNDFWKRMAQHYKDEPTVFAYSLINEPGASGDNDVWNTTIAPSTIAAIRTVDMNKTIIVPTSTGGYGHFFKFHLAGLPMQDAGNNLIYEAHFYFDTPPNGQYPNGWDVPNNDMMIGVKNATDFVNWCKTNNQRCYAGEYGIPAGWQYGTQTCLYLGGTNKDPRWLTVLDNFLDYLDENKISGTYWAGGPYGDISSLGPFCQTGQNSGPPYIDGPQMAILTQHLGSEEGTTPSPQCRSDINQSGFTDLTDYSILVANFFKSSTNWTHARADIDGDDFVDLSDYSLLVASFFKTCP